MTKLQPKRKSSFSPTTPTSWPLWAHQSSLRKSRVKSLMKRTKRNKHSSNQLTWMLLSWLKLTRNTKTYQSQALMTYSTTVRMIPSLPTETLSVQLSTLPRSNPQIPRNLLSNTTRRQRRPPPSRVQLLLNQLVTWSIKYNSWLRMFQPNWTATHTESCCTLMMDLELTSSSEFNLIISTRTMMPERR